MNEACLGMNCVCVPMQFTVSDKAVVALALRAFFGQASNFLDASSVQAANTSFFASYVFDDR